MTWLTLFAICLLQMVYLLPTGEARMCTNSFCK